MGRFDDLPPEFRKLLILYGAFFVVAAAKGYIAVNLNKKSCILNLLNYGVDATSGDNLIALLEVC